MIANNRLHKASSFNVIEPRISHLEMELSRLLSFFEFQCGGRTVDVDGFRLRDLSQWRSATTNTAMNALVPISGSCNSKCDFCFEEGIPFPREQSFMPLSEARTRLKHYDPKTGQALFPSNRPNMEPFLHPQAVDIIALAREREPSKLFWLTSNGSHFDEATVGRLASLKPLIFKLSLNVVDPEINRRLMKTKGGLRTALSAPEMLQRHGIPFMGSIVAWPTIPLSAIEDTVQHLAAHEAYAVRIRLPLTHRWLDAQVDADFAARWREVAEFAKSLRSHVDVPLFIEPPIYWVKPIVPEVEGVVLNSPAYRAGVRAGDRVLRINGVNIGTRIESEATLDDAHLRGLPVDLDVERHGNIVNFHMPDPGEDIYPYNPNHFYRGENYGIFHVEDFRLRYVADMLNVIERYDAHRVLLFTSPILADVLCAVLQGVPDFSRQLQDVHLHIGEVRDPTPGGNYDMMDSRFVDDYEREVRRLRREGLDVDLVLIPDAFGSSWGLDMAGKSYQHLATALDVPVELVDWYILYGREV